MSDKAIKLSQAKTLYDDLRERVESVDSQVVVSDTEPQEVSNKLWIDTEEGQEYSIPTYAEFSQLSGAINAKADVKTPQETASDLYICDENGNVIAEFKDGHIVTKNFDSGNIDADLIEDTVENTADLFVCDANGNVIAEFANGHIKTKYFDSSSSATSGILSRVDKQTDGVYATCRWHQPSLSDKQFCLLLASTALMRLMLGSCLVICLGMSIQIQYPIT